MARGINKVILVGNLGQDPEIRYTANNLAIANLSLATSDQWKDRQTGQMQDRTEWHRVVMFGRLGEIAGEYLRKGMQVYIEGRLQTRKWQGQDGQDRYTTEIVANEMQMLGGRGAGGGSTDFEQRSNQGKSNQPSQTGSQSAAAPREKAPEQASDNFDGFDDDIPF